LSRNSKRWEVNKGNRQKQSVTAKVYDPAVADNKYKDRRKQAKYSGMLLHENDELKNYVIEKLKLGWSPASISGRMEYLKLGFYASKRAIYEYLYSPYGQQYCKYLLSQRYNKRRRKAKKL
jgi:IS30 family transposase